jgi:hypothetical protein
MQFTANGNAQKTLVAASEQSRSGDGIASAGATSGESIKRKNGEISDSEMLHLFPNRNIKNTYFIQG